MAQNKGYNPFLERSSVIVEEEDDFKSLSGDALAEFLEANAKPDFAYQDVTLYGRSENEKVEGHDIYSFFAERQEHVLGLEIPGTTDDVVLLRSDSLPELEFSPQPDKPQSGHYAIPAEEGPVSDQADDQWFLGQLSELSETIPHSPPSCLQSLDWFDSFSERKPTQTTGDSNKTSTSNPSKLTVTSSVSAPVPVAEPVDSSLKLDQSIFKGIDFVGGSDFTFTTSFDLSSVNQLIEGEGRESIIANLLGKKKAAQSFKSKSSTVPPESTSRSQEHLNRGLHHTLTSSSSSHDQMQDKSQNLVQQSSELKSSTSHESVTGRGQDILLDLDDGYQSTSLLNGHNKIPDTSDGSLNNPSSQIKSLSGHIAAIERRQVNQLDSNISHVPTTSLTGHDQLQDMNRILAASLSFKSKSPTIRSTPVATSDEDNFLDLGVDKDHHNLTLLSGRDQLLNNSSYMVCNDTANETLPCNMTIRDTTVNMESFMASTPLVNNYHKVGDTTRLGLSAIDCIVSPERVLENILDLPSHVEVPDVCCVNLSQQVQFSIKNKLKWGVKCVFSLKEVIFEGRNVIGDAVCPFDVRPQMTLRPNSQETVQVLFTPTYAGEYCATLEVRAQNMSNPKETRTNMIILSGRAEYPKLRVLPNSEELDFGDLIWGTSHHKTIKVQNVGCSTVPIRFSVIRTKSPLCSFSFQPPDSIDLSRISLTNRPEAVSSVISMPLIGVKDGQEIVTHSIDLFCHTKGFDTACQTYLESSEVFEGLLSMEVDTPIPRHQPLVKFKLRVRVGMIKLHLDKASLTLSTLPGQVTKGAVKVINSGNIRMKVDLRLDPPGESFHLHTTEMIIEPQACQMAAVTFKPKEFVEVNTKLILCDEMNIHNIPVVGQTRRKASKITASASAVLFGGTPIGEKSSKKFHFHVDQDAVVKFLVQQGSSSPSVFQLATDQGGVQKCMELSVKKRIRYSITIVFAPEDVKSYSALLAIQVVKGDNFSVPVTGYGGVSQVTLSGVTEIRTGESVVYLNKLDSGSPITHRLSVTNTGVRSAFVKTQINDMSRNAMSPQHATIMPSQLFLQPNESQEMILMFIPSDDDKMSCVNGKAFVGIVKMTYGEEITRQLLIRNGSPECQRLALSYGLELTPDQKAMVDYEMSAIVGAEKSALNLFKASVKWKKVGLLGEMVKSTRQSPQLTLTTAASRQGTSVRPVLQTVNLNGQEQQSKCDLKETWSLSPVSISFKVLDARSKEFFQVINYNDKDLRFSVEADDCLSVVPSQGIISNKNWCSLEVLTNSNFWTLTSKPSCALIKIKCHQETKHIRVLIDVENKITFPPTFTTSSSISKAQSMSSVEKRGMSSLTLNNPVNSLSSSCRNHHDQRDDTTTTGSDKCIRAPEIVIIPPVSPGERTEMKYAFTNIGREPIEWNVVAIGNIHCDNTEVGDDCTTDVFRSCPPSGKLEAGGVQTIGLEFCPFAVGSYNQSWGIKVKGGSNQPMSSSIFHTLTIYAKANNCGGAHSEKNSSSPSVIPVSMDSSPKRLQQQHHQYSTKAPSYDSQRLQDTNHPAQWTPCHPQSSDRVSVSTSSATTTTTTSSIASSKPRRSDVTGDHHGSTDRTSRLSESRCLQLVEKTLRFKTLQKGTNETRYLLVKNMSSKNAEIVLEQEPEAPFIIRHHNFSVNKDRMTKLPVIFKPLHAARFRTEVVMRDKFSNVRLTAILEAECIP